MSMVARIFRELKRISGKLREVNGPVEEYWTEYMNWLSFANSGMMTKGNAYCFNYAIKNLPTADPIVEIGSFCGLSTNMITYFKEQHGVKNPLFSCDRWQFEGAEKGGPLGDSKSIDHPSYKAFVRETYIRNTRMFSKYDLPHTIEVFSDEFFELWAANTKRNDVFGNEAQMGGPISFCFIDGNHTYDFAKRDFENTDKFLVPGGFILFDDSADGSDWEVCRVVREVQQSGRYELVARNPNYFFRKKA